MNFLYVVDEDDKKLPTVYIAHQQDAKEHRPKKAENSAAEWPTLISGIPSFLTDYDALLLGEAA